MLVPIALGRDGGGAARSQHCAIAKRRRARDLAKGGREMALTGKTDLKRQVRQGDRTIHQQGFRPFDPAMQLIAMGGNAHRLLETAAKVENRQIGGFCHLIKRDIVAKVRLDQVGHPCKGRRVEAALAPGFGIGGLKFQPHQMNGQKMRHTVGKQCRTERGMHDLGEQVIDDLVEGMIGDGEKIRDEIGPRNRRFFRHFMQKRRAEIKIDPVALSAPLPGAGLIGGRDRNAVGGMAGAIDPVRAGPGQIGHIQMTGDEMVCDGRAENRRIEPRAVRQDKVGPAEPLACDFWATKGECVMRGYDVGDGGWCQHPGYTFILRIKTKN